VSTPNDVDLNQPRPPLAALLGVREFRRLPSAVEAVRFETEQMGSLLAEWCQGTNESSPELVEIPALDGVTEIHLGDWAVLDHTGTVHALTDEDFHDMFEPAW
jgi:hypothetical protein